MNEQESCDKVTGRENGISNSYNEIKITTGRTLAQKKVKSLSFVLFCIKIRHSLPSSKLKSSFYLSSFHLQPRIFLFFGKFKMICGKFYR